MRRRLPLLRTVAAFGLALLASAALALLALRLDRVVVAHGVLDGASLAVRAPDGGIVARVLVEDGARVAAGTPLFELDTAAIDAERAELEARMAARDRELAALAGEARLAREEVHPAEHAEAQRERARASLERDAARTRAQRLEELGREGLATQLDRDGARLAEEVAELVLAGAEHARERLAARHALELERLRGRIAALDAEHGSDRARWGELGRRRGRALVESPLAGRVVAPGLARRAGSHVAAGEELLRVVAGGPLVFEAELADAGRRSARVGQRARLRLDGYPWVVHGVAEGRVERIAARRDAGTGFHLTIALDEASLPGPVWEGMGGQARILVEEDVPLARLFLERITGEGAR